MEYKTKYSTTFGCKFSEDDIKNFSIINYLPKNIKEKFNILVTLLGRRPSERGIIFCRTKAGTKDLTEKLIDEGFSVGALEGDMQQKERLVSLKNKAEIALAKENIDEAIDLYKQGLIDFPNETFFKTKSDFGIPPSGKIHILIPCLSFSPAFKNTENRIDFYTILSIWMDITYICLMKRA